MKLKRARVEVGREGGRAAEEHEQEGGHPLRREGVQGHVAIESCEHRRAEAGLHRASAAALVE
jgi:hypothetical protein